MHPLRTLSRVAPLLIVLLLSSSVAAQDKQAAKATPTPVPTPSGLALELDRKFGPPTYNSVPGGFSSGVSRRLPPARVPVGAALARTFTLSSVMEGDAVRVKVFAIMDRFNEREILLGDYLLREGGEAVVDEMAQYGYEPLGIKVVRVKRESSALPTATSRAASVEAVSIGERQSNFPSYRVTLRNLSDKAITYLELQTFQGNRPASTYWPRGELNRPLIKAGETYEDIVPGTGPAGRKSDDGYTPTSIDRVEVVAAVFADRSYEGNADSAQRFLAMLLGQRMQLERALPILENAASSEAADERAALENLEQRIAALSRDWDAATLEDVPAGFSEFAPESYRQFENLVEGSLDRVRKELLKDVAEYKQAGTSGAQREPYGAWLSGIRRKYEAWRSRL